MLRRALVLMVLVGWLCRPSFGAEFLWSSADGGNDHWYHIRDELVTFDEIEYQLTHNIVGAPLAGLGPGPEGYAPPAHLSIDSPEELAFVANAIASSGSSTYTAIWIALSDRASPGTFAWENGSPLGLANWAPGEPNGSGGVVIVDPYNPVWEVRPLTDRYWWAAEVSPVPEPASFSMAAAAFLITGLFWRKMRAVS